MELTGLTTKEVEHKKKLGLANDKLESFAPSKFKIIRKNFFSIMNLFLIPLLFLLAWVDRWGEVFVFLTFIIVTMIMNSSEELRIKRRLEKLQSEFRQKVKVIREGIEKEVPASEIVEGDLIKADEGDIIVADGQVVKDYYLQIDESALTGESNYLVKEKGDTVRSGAFVVTGYCYYIAEKIGKDNFLNQLGQKSTKIQKRQSDLERWGNGFITFFVIMTAILTVISLATGQQSGADRVDIVLSATTIITLVIPQTLLFLISLNFVISVSKLSQKGIIVQARGAIDELANIDILCMDKTGTITSNKMYVKRVEENGLDFEYFASVINSISDKVVSKNITFDAIEEYSNKSKTQLEINDFDQIPFNSKNKYSVYTFNGKSILLGAFSSLKPFVDSEAATDLENQVSEFEEKGSRVVVALEFGENIIADREIKKGIKSSQTLLLEIKELLNPGIEDVLIELRSQGIRPLIISGDSKRSIERILLEAGMSDLKSVDLSEIKNKDYKKLVEKYDIFARSQPEDKLAIVETLRDMGKKVAMIGDGINDVLSIKQADVGIAMESGSKITRDTADIVLLGNDYKKIPTIFFEGNNIVFNLKLSTKIYVAKAFLAAVLVVFFGLRKELVPILPTTTLIFSFLGNTFPSYLVVLSRQKITPHYNFVKDVLASAIPAGIANGLITVVGFLVFKDYLNYSKLNTVLVFVMLGTSMTYTFYLLWDYRKLTNIFILTGGYFAGFLLGIFQTLMPIYLIRELWQKIIAILAVTFGAVVVFKSIDVAAKTNPKLKKLAIILGIGFIPLGLFFPAREYYAADPTPIEYFPVIFSLSVLYLVLLLILHNTVMRIARK